jgi:hypothetical protein
MLDRTRCFTIGAIRVGRVRSKKLMPFCMDERIENELTGELPVCIRV